MPENLHAYLILIVFLCLTVGCHAAGEAEPVDIFLRQTVQGGAFRDLQDGEVVVQGAVERDVPVHIRVTTNSGVTSYAVASARNGGFSVKYPSAFHGAPVLQPCSLFIDATTSNHFDVSTEDHRQAEAAILVYDSKEKQIPDLPTGFTTDLLDSQGRTDSQSAEWSAVRTLVNLYMRSTGARIAGVGRPHFDLARPADLAWFTNNLTLYDFDNRDRDWSKPLANRVARTFWQAVWDHWFNPSNDHPLDGDDQNRDHSNYQPYTFANDFADILIMHLMHLDDANHQEDNLRQMCTEAVRNLLAMQHTEPTNFAIEDHRGIRENYTSGAFRYGMFENGEFLVERKGWFYTGKFLDYAHGGVFNGRAIWAMGEALKADPNGPLADELKDAIRLAVRFCLNDSLESGYAKKTAQGNVYWRDAGEHAYLLIGAVAACSVDPDMQVVKPGGSGTVTLREVCAQSLDALVDLAEPHHQWARYPNWDSMAIAALADGCLLLTDHKDAENWRRTAVQVADAWLSAEVDPSEYPCEPVHFGLRPGPQRMTYKWNDRNIIYFYQSGHWIHALARLYALTGDTRYRQRAEAMVSYLCGENPWGVRLLNELGGVYNWVQDTDGDGIEDQLKQNMYPESTAFCRIGIAHLLHAIADAKSGEQ